MISQIDESWTPYLKDEFKRPYMKDLFKFLEREKESGKVIYPAETHIFEAFRLTPFTNVKIVIIGQDPYHGPSQAHGLCFSVQKGIPVPPSLKNIFKELEDDVGVSPPSHGFLESWAKEGVLLLNTVLTVEDGKAGSHHKIGWEQFTDKVIRVLNENKENLVFILWGSPAQKKAAIVDENKHLVLKAVHPSPLSFYRGFLKSKPFSKSNSYLRSYGKKEINWKL